MKFEFNENKSQANKVKHGIDFREAQALLNELDVTVQCEQKNAGLTRNCKRLSVLQRHTSRLTDYFGRDEGIYQDRGSGQQVTVSRESVDIVHSSQ